MYIFNTPYSKRQIFLNSVDASFYLNGAYKSSILFYFNEHISVPPYLDIVMKVENASIPISVYNVNYTNNELYIDNILYTIPVANYSSYQLRDQLNTLLSGVSITITYDSKTNKYTFTSTSNFTINSSSSCLSLIGFDSGDHTSIAYQLTSNYMIDLSGIRVINVATNLTSNNIDSYNKGKNNVLCSIPVSVSKYGLNVVDYSSSNYVKINDKNINYILISLYDENFNYINLNNVDWTMTIEFSFIVPPTLTIPNNILLDNQNIKEGIKQD